MKPTALFVLVLATVALTASVATAPPVLAAQPSPAAQSSAAAPAPPDTPEVYTPPASVNRTPVGSAPAGSWSQTAPLTPSKSSTATNPAATAVAAGSLGATPAAGSPAVASSAAGSSAAGSSAAGAGLGVQGFYGLETFGLDTINGLQAQVNLANGNLVVHATDLKISSPGLGLRLDRFYNSQASGVGAFGANTVLSTGRDVGLQVGAGSITFTGPSGFTATFTGTGPTYTTPPGVNADLVMNADGTFTLTYHSSSERLTFTAGGFLTSDADRNGNALVLLYNTDNTLASITDTAGPGHHLRVREWGAVAVHRPGGPLLALHLRWGG